MFTGIIEDLATVTAITPLTAGRRLVISTAIPPEDLRHGESITVDGACMTVVETRSDGFAVDVSAESLRCSTLGDLAPGDRVNLERSVRMSDRLGGHLVSGHVDGIATVAEIRPEGESAVYSFEASAALCDLLVEKGSVAVDGISLTCFNCKATRFDVAVIPHTAAVTTLGRKKVGDQVNLENDMVAKYVAKLAAPLLRERE